MAHFGRLFSLNAFAFFCSGLFVFFPDITELHPLFGTFRSLVMVIIAFPLAGLNLTLILEKLTRQSLDLLERLVVTAALSLTAVPVILMFEYATFQIASSLLPIINTLGLFLAVIILCPHALQRNIVAKPSLNLSCSLGIATAIFIFTWAAVVGAYPILPDSDPYYWLTKVQHELVDQELPRPGSYRPLFTFVSFPFIVTADVDAYTFFKYLLPFFFLLILLPGALIARRFDRSLVQIAFLLLPLSSASFILYFLLPIPQAILSIVIAFFCLCLIHSFLSKQDFFYFLAGGIILLGYFYHELTLFFALPWIMVTAATYRKPLWEYAERHPFAILLFILLLFSHFSFFVSIFDFFANWLARIVQHLSHWQINTQFPTAYVNIDGKAVGWAGVSGVVKYYLYYGGPLLLLTIVLSYIGWRKGIFGQLAVKQYVRSKEGWVLFLAGALFFTLAEVLPRLPGLALLPERALGFFGLVAALTVLWAMLQTADKQKQYGISLLLLAACAINIGGAVYINSLKKDLISPARLASMLWIRDHLPEERTIFVRNDLAVMQTYSQTSDIVEMLQPDFFTNTRPIDDYLRNISPVPFETSPAYRESLTKMHQNLTLLAETPRAPAIALLTGLSETARDLAQELQSTRGTSTPPSEKKMYIYYNEPSRDTLYSDRPYATNSEQKITAFVFDQYPKRFKKVYNDIENGIILWEVIQH